MASGILGQINLTAASTWTSVYTVPASKVATLNLAILNVGAVSASMRVALATSTSPSVSEYIEFNMVLAPGDVFERGGLVLDAGKKVVVWASHASPNMAILVTGYEE